MCLVFLIALLASGSIDFLVGLDGWAFFSSEVVGLTLVLGSPEATLGKTEDLVVSTYSSGSLEFVVGRTGDLIG